MVITWSSEAKKSLDRIFYFYEDKSKQAAGAIVADIYKSIKSLAKYPQIAAIEPMLADSSQTYRSLIVRHIFKIIYRIDDVAEKIIIVTIWDCRQNPDNLTLLVNS